MKGFCELIPHGLISIFDANELEVCSSTFIAFNNGLGRAIVITLV